MPGPAEMEPSATPPSAGRLAVVQPGGPSLRDRADGARRAIEVLLRSLHLVSMGLLLGGVFLGGTFATLRGPIVATLLTGGLLLLTSMRWGCLDLRHGAGWAVLVKLALLGLGNLFHGARLECYALATVVASVGSHMPSAWRHYTFRWLRGPEEDGGGAAPP